MLPFTLVLLPLSSSFAIFHRRFSAIHPLQPCATLFELAFLSRAANQTTRAGPHPKETRNPTLDSLPVGSGSVRPVRQASGEDSWRFVRSNPLNQQSLSPYDGHELDNKTKDHHILLDLHGSHSLPACAHVRVHNEGRENLCLHREAFIPSEAIPLHQRQQPQALQCRASSVYIHEPSHVMNSNEPRLPALTSPPPRLLAFRGGNDLRCQTDGSLGLFVQRTKRLLQKKKFQ